MTPSPSIRKSGGGRPYDFPAYAGSKAIGHSRGITVPTMDDRHSPERGEMNKNFDFSPQILCRTVGRHQKARSIALRVERWTRSLWGPFRRMLCKYFRHNETTALRAVAVSRPTIPDEAREKLLYLMALTIAEAAEPGRPDMDTAIETLRPFRADLAGLWEPEPSTIESLSSIEGGDPAVR